MKRHLPLLQNQAFDLLVCGGGIYGAWTAYDAALRGLKVAIVEQGDWASTTSSASSKLIHGGLRYLESYDFKLVKKSLAERQMLLKMAPHRVWPLRFGVPVYADSRIGMLRLKLGLMLYDFFAAENTPAMRHRHFDSPHFAAHFPILNKSMLKGGFVYTDAQTDDARLVLELIAGAMDAGAVCVNYCKVIELMETEGRAYGAQIQDQINNTIQEIHAKQIVQTIGQWISTATTGRDWCRLAKGIHLVMPAVLKDEALLLTAKSDGRVFFMMPWYGFTLLGTTDTDYRGDPAQINIEAEDVSYLLAAANSYLKAAWTETDIISGFAGVRVLKQSAQSMPSAVSRDWELKTTNNGVHYSIGGKITSARQDAAHIVDTVCTQLGIKTTCATQNRPFPWAPTENYTEWLSAMQAQATKLNIDAESTKWLIRRHGKRVKELYLSIESKPELAARIIPSLPLILADLQYCARHEMVVHLDDLLRRRLPLMILTQLTEDHLRQITAKLTDILDWDETVISQEIENCRQYPLYNE